MLYLSNLIQLLLQVNNMALYRFQINNKKYVFMFSNNYDGKSDLIQNADEDVDCMTYAQDTSLYSNDSFFVFV